MEHTGGTRHQRPAASVLAVLAAAVCASAGGARIPRATTTPSRILFDDFDYPSTDLPAHGWSVRSQPGGPGATGASWSPAGVSIVADPTHPANHLLRLEGETDGTVAGTFQAQVERMTSTSRAGSLSGWHTLVIQVAHGDVRYFVDGRQGARHGGRSYPDSPMSIVFNVWFQIDGLLPLGPPRRYRQDVDRVFQQPDAVLSPSQVLARVARLRV
jgi:hypothetical protein